MTIRPAKREELRAVAAFLNASWRSAYKAIFDPDYLATLDDEERHQRWLENYDNGARPVLLLEHDELLGVCNFGPSQTPGFPEDGEVAAIYIREDAIGKGYGHALLLYAEDALRVQGYAHLVLDVLSQNKRAIKFYQAYGYTKVGQRNFTRAGKDYPLDIMRKSS